MCLWGLTRVLLLRHHAATGVLYGGGHSVTCWATKLCHSDSVYSKIHHGVLNVQVAAFCRWTASDASWLRGYSNWFSMAPRLHFMTCVPTQRTHTSGQSYYGLSHKCTCQESCLIAEYSLQQYLPTFLYMYLHACLHDVHVDSRFVRQVVCAVDGRLIKSWRLTPEWLLIAFYRAVSCCSIHHDCGSCYKRQFS